MRNIVIIIAIFFWILNMISKSKKKQQQVLERKRISDLNKRVIERTETQEYEPEQSTYNRRSAEEIATLFSERQVQAPATDYELAYASNDYAIAEKSVESSSVVTEHEPVSHFQKNYGMVKSLGTESAEEKDAYDKDIPVIPRLSLTSGGIKQYIVASEILGKPKALRR